METQHGQEAYAGYSVFTVGPELEGYRISTLGTYYGTAGIVSLNNRNVWAQHYYNVVKEQGDKYIFLPISTYLLQATHCRITLDKSFPRWTRTMTSGKTALVQQSTAGPGGIKSAIKGILLFLCY